MLADARAVAAQLEREHYAAVADLHAHRGRGKARQDLCRQTYAAWQAADHAVLRATIAAQAERWRGWGYADEARQLEQALHGDADALGLIVLSTRLACELSAMGFPDRTPDRPTGVHRARARPLGLGPQ